MLGYAILLFFVIVMGSVMVYLALGKSAASEVQRVKARLLGKTAKPAKNKDGSGEAPALIKGDEPAPTVSQKILVNLQLAERVQALIERAGMRWTSAKLMQIAMASGLAALCAGLYLLPPPFDKIAWGLCLAGFAAPFVYVFQKGSVRMKKFEEQFPDSLEFVARS